MPRPPRRKPFVSRLYASIAAAHRPRKHPGSTTISFMGEPPRGAEEPLPPGPSSTFRRGFQTHVLQAPNWAPRPNLLRKPPITGAGRAANEGVPDGPSGKDRDDERRGPPRGTRGFHRKHAVRPPGFHADQAGRHRRAPAVQDRREGPDFVALQVHARRAGRRRRRDGRGLLDSDKGLNRGRGIGPEMRGGQGSACLLAIALLSALPPSLPAQPTPGPAPVGPIFVDAPAWLLNDTWTYTTHALTRAPNGMRTDTTLVLTTRIVEVSTRTVRSTSYTTYNATTNGNITTDGEIPLGGLGTRPFHLQGTSSGWVWTDRSDLAVIVTNQTGNATGWVDLGFPFGRQPLEADGATTILFLPALEDFDFPLELADAWSHTVTANTTGYVHFRAQTPIGPQENTTRLAGETSGSTSFWLNTTEDVTVTAGTFANATHIHTAANGAGFGDRWYHPDAKNIVRSESHSVAAVNDYSHVWVNLTAMSLVLPPWPGTIVLNPQRVDPGGWIAASGTANPNEDLV